MTRGGKRPGAGRPAPNGTGRRRQIYAKPDTWDYLTRDGRKASTEIERLVGEDREMMSQNDSKINLSMIETKTTTQFVQTGTDWKNQNHWWHWATRSPAGRAALEKIGCTVNPEEPWKEGIVTVYRQWWRVQHWIDPDKEMTPTDNQFGAAKIREVMGENCGMFYAELCTMNEVSFGVIFSNRTMIGVNSDGSRAVISECAD